MGTTRSPAPRRPPGGAVPAQPHGRTRTERRVRLAQRELVRQARDATGARVVTLGQLDARRHAIACRALAAEPSDRYRRTLAELAAVAPGYRPDRYVLPLRLNPDCLTAFTGAAPVLWPFGRICAGQRHQEVADVFRDVMGVRWTLHVPVRVRGRAAGALDFEFARRPTVRQSSTAAAFGRLAALCIENAVLTSDLEQALAEARGSHLRATAADERVRAEIAELLHGRVQGHLLIAVRQIEEARRMVGPGLAGAGALLRDVAAMLDALREREVRQASHLLHPTAIRSGLVPALSVLAERFAPSVRVTLDVPAEVARLDHPIDGRLGDAVRLAAFRVAEEALANVVRHAGTRQVAVLLGLVGGAGGPALRIEIRDGGKGFDAARTRAGLGLELARDRVVQLGGTLRLSSAPGRGTRVSATLPLTPRADGPPYYAPSCAGGWNE